MTDRRYYLLEMYNYIIGFKPSLYPWQWDYNYEDDMNGRFYMEDLVAYKQIVKMVREGDEYRERKMVSVNESNNQPVRSQPKPRPRFTFIKE